MRAGESEDMNLVSLYYYICLCIVGVVYHSAFFMTKTAPLFALIKALAVSCDLRSSRLLSPTLWPYALIVHTVLITMKCQMIIQCYNVLYIHPIFSALCTHTHTRVYIHLKTWHKLRYRSALCTTISEANFLVQAVKLDPLGLVTSLDTTLTYIIIAVSVSMCVMSRYVSIFCMIWLNNSLASVRVVIGTCLWKVSSAKGTIGINVDQFGAKCKMLLKHHQGLKGNAAHQHIRILERSKKDGGQRAFWDFLMSPHASAMLQSPPLTTPIHSPADRTSTARFSLAPPEIDSLAPPLSLAPLTLTCAPQDRLTCAPTGNRGGSTGNKGGEGGRV